MLVYTVTKRIFEYTEKAGFDMDKLRGVGTDGAATMLGCKSGVVVRLKEQTPTLIGVHCAAHRLNLASSQAADKVGYVKKFHSILRQLCDFFENSTVRMAGLQAIQTLIQEKDRLLATCIYYEVADYREECYAPQDMLYICCFKPRKGG